MEAWGLTDTGNVRKQNQDYYDIVRLGPQQLLLVVCDGMGGAKSGNVVRRLGREAVVGVISRPVRSGRGGREVGLIMRDAVSLANETVFEQSQISADFEGMGTTLVAAFLLPACAVIANVGDSRAYLMDGQGIRFVTVDHSLVELMVRRGELTREQAKNDPGKNVITRAVGTDAAVACDIYRMELKPGNALVLCSDGLSNLMADQEILFEVVHGVQKEQCCQRLLEIAKNRGAPDNVTVIVATV